MAIAVKGDLCKSRGVGVKKARWCQTGKVPQKGTLASKRHVSHWPRPLHRGDPSKCVAKKYISENLTFFSSLLFHIYKTKSHHAPESRKEGREEGWQEGRQEGRRQEGRTVRQLQTYFVFGAQISHRLFLSLLLLYIAASAVRNRTASTSTRC